MSHRYIHRSKEDWARLIGELTKGTMSSSAYLERKLLAKKVMQWWSHQPLVKCQGLGGLPVACARQLTFLKVEWERVLEPYSISQISLCFIYLILAVLMGVSHWSMDLFPSNFKRSTSLGDLKETQPTDFSCGQKESLRLKCLNTDKCWSFTQFLGEFKLETARFIVELIHSIV